MFFFAPAGEPVPFPPGKTGGPDREGGEWSAKLSTRPAVVWRPIAILRLYSNSGVIPIHGFLVQPNYRAGWQLKLLSSSNPCRVPWFEERGCFAAQKIQPTSCFHIVVRR